MLTGIHTVFIGGDARTLEVIQKVVDMDAVVTLVGFENLQNQFPGVKKQELSVELMEKADAVILAVVGTDHEGKIESLFSSQTIYLTDQHIQALPEHAVIYTGMARDYLKQLCNQYEIKLTELLERDDVAIYNSIPTAEGAVMMAIQNTDITIHGSKCMVLGLGRTGMTLGRTLQGMGANVKAGVRRPEHYARAVEMGFQPFYIEDLIHEVKSIDLLFNTVPAQIVTAKVIANLPHKAVIIDLASRPGGTDFRFAEKRGITALLAPGLPGIVAPKTAGQIIARCLIQILEESKENGGNNVGLER